MTRCIYVGEEKWTPDLYRTEGPSLLHYGITGTAERSESIAPGKWLFGPDGSHSGRWVDNSDLYFPTHQQTRHCPKK